MEGRISSVSPPIRSDDTTHFYTDLHAAYAPTMTSGTKGNRRRKKGSHRVATIYIQHDERRGGEREARSLVYAYDYQAQAPVDRMTNAWLSSIAPAQEDDC